MLRLTNTDNKCPKQKTFNNQNSVIYPGMIGYLNTEHEVDLLQSENSVPVILDDVRDDSMNLNTMYQGKITVWKLSGDDSIKSFQTDIFEYKKDTQYCEGDYVYTNDSLLSLIPNGEPVGKVVNFDPKCLHVECL